MNYKNLIMNNQDPKYKEKTITIVDYGLGNILSVSRAFAYLGCNVALAKNSDEIEKASYLVLPGVGAFKKGMYELQAHQLIEPIKDYAKSGRPLLGICLGMQLLFESSEEIEICKGLEILSGHVKRIVSTDSNLKVPHIGWANLSMNPFHPNYSQDRFVNSLEKASVYFVHSYHPVTSKKNILAVSDYYHHEITSAVLENNIWGYQFHPEKSGKAGLELLKLFLSFS
ncbi:MAG: imidazole glycerol phosphate synthase subunit HisH [Proteobacteria bacterium]|nr:imidazole glycerol phosphate synthase subunit HisH [Pseudomonadota bacterium]